MARALERSRRRAASGFADGSGARIWYRTLGRGEPVVLLHGGPGADHTDFLPYLAPLARHFRLVLFDQRGCGRSERLADTRRYSLKGMVADLEALRKHLGIEQWNVLGHSFGGILAQAYAVRHPRRVTRLILAGTASSARAVDADFRRIRRQQAAHVRARLAAFERRGIYLPDGGYEPHYARLSGQVLGPYMYARGAPKRAAPPIATDVLGEMWSNRTEFRITGNLKGFDFTHKLRNLSIPVLVIAGDRDLVSPATLELTRRSCRCATLVIMARCAHMMFVERTRFFNDLVRTFLVQSSDSVAKRRRVIP
jgi:proline iminopeptidase